MNWDALGAVAELVGAIGVIITLAYLATQIRHSTKMMRVTVKQNQTSITHKLLDVTRENIDLYMKANSGAELTEKEEIEYQLMARGAFRGWENYCYMREEGLLDDTEWEGIRSSMKHFGTLPGNRRAYAAMRNELSARLRSVLDTILDENPEST